MSTLASRWTGKIYGTNTGNVFLELSQDENNITGRFRIMDTIFGVSVYDCTGTFDDRIVLECIPTEEIDGIVQGTVKVEGTITPQGNIQGSWESSIGTAGTFEMCPHDLSGAKNDSLVSEGIPEQIYNKTIPIGSVRLFKQDVCHLINFIKKDFTEGRVIVTYTQRGSELTKYASDFFDKLDNIEQLNYIKLVIQEPEAHNINRVVIIELASSGISEVRVSGINESWVLGKAESIYQLMKPSENTLVTTYRKYGLTLNGAIFMAMLIVIPEIIGWQKRAIFVISIYIILILLLSIHNKLIPNTTIYINQSEPGIFKRVWPSILSWLIAASSSVVAATIFYFLRNFSVN